MELLLTWWWVWVCPLRVREEPLTYLVVSVCVSPQSEGGTSYLLGGECVCVPSEWGRNLLLTWWWVCECPLKVREEPLTYLVVSVSVSPQSEGGTSCLLGGECECVPSEWGRNLLLTWWWVWVCPLRVREEPLTYLVVSVSVSPQSEGGTSCLLGGECECVPSEWGRNLTYGIVRPEKHHSYKRACFWTFIHFEIYCVFREEYWEWKICFKKSLEFLITAFYFIFFCKRTCSG